MTTSLPVTHTQAIDLDSSLDRDILGFLVKIAILDSGKDEIQKEIIKELSRILVIDSCTLYLRDESTDHWVIRKTFSADELWTSHVVPIDELGRAAQVIYEGEGYVSKESTEGWVHILPLVVAGDAIGALAFNKEVEVNRDLLVAICQIFAHSLSQARSARQAEETILEMQTFQGQLLNSRNTLRALFDSSPASIYIVDPNYRLIAVNMTRSDLVGRPPQKLVGEDCFSALYGRSDPCPHCQVAETFQYAKKTRRIENRGNEEYGRLEIEVSTFPIWDNQRNTVQVFVYEEDVTERQQLQISLAQSEKLAAVGQLAAGVAHEINNPLTAIQANAQLLQRSMSSSDTSDLEMIEVIIEASERASQAVRDLLDFSRQERYQIAPVDLNETIQRTLALMGPELGSRSISLQFDPSFDLPLINASQDHLQGVWLNLMINAIDAIDEGPGVIVIKSRRVENNIEVSVTDSGRGISEDKIPRIFEPFFTTKEPGRGTGLGLSVCHQIVTRHGGHMRVSSQLGKSTTFTVVLPIS